MQIRLLTALVKDDADDMHADFDICFSVPTVCPHSFFLPNFSAEGDIQIICIIKSMPCLIAGGGGAGEQKAAGGTSA